MYFPNGNIDVAEVFENAIIRLSDEEIELKNVNWVPHPEFARVKIKNIVDGDKTNGMFSFYLMYLEPDAEIADFRLDGMLEVHSILDGEGICSMKGREISYKKGIVHTINDGEIINLHAGKCGLKILVIFAPGCWE